jgi:hypothetical protein
MGRELRASGFYMMKDMDFSVLGFYLIKTWSLGFLGFS